MQDTEHVLTSEGLAARWGVAVNTIAEATRAGQIPHRRVGRRVIYPLVAIEQFELDAVVEIAPTPSSSKVTPPPRRRRRIVQAEVA